MLGSGTVGQRVLWSVCLLATLLSGSAALPSTASAQDPPQFSNASISPTTLPHTGGTVSVSALVYHDQGTDGIREVYAEVGGEFGNVIVPMTSTASGGSVLSDWNATFNVPANPNPWDSSFYVQVYAIGTDGSVADTFAGQGTIEAAPAFNEPPVISDPSVTPSRLPHTGGIVTLAVTASDLGGISGAYALVSTGAGSPIHRVSLDAISADRFQGTFAAPASTSNADTTYFVNFVAADHIGQESSQEGPTFAVAGRPTGSLAVVPTDRDFGKVKLGRTATRNVVLRNTGGKTTFPVSGVLRSSGAPFSVGGQIEMPFTLKPGEKRTFTIAFAPKVLGQATGRIDVVRSDAKQPGLDVTVTGRGT